MNDAPIAEWIEWEGGERPVDADTLVIVRFRHGSESRGQKRADRFWWGRSEIHSGGDIVAYRLPAPSGEDHPNDV